MGTRSIAVASFSALILALASGIRVTPAAQEQNSPFQGVWRTLEVVVPRPAPRTFRPEATLAIFHGRHYSRVEVHTEQPRQPLADRQPRRRTSSVPSGGPSSARRAPSP